MIADDFTVAAPFDDSQDGWWEVAVPDDAFPGGVIAQIHIQLEQAALCAGGGAKRLFRATCAQL